MSKNQRNYLTTHDLMERWHCKMAMVNAFMHRKGSGAIKIGRRLLVDEKEVIQYENSRKVRPELSKN